jgi:hypothetical protein
VKIEPRERILEIWKAVVAASYDQKSGQWLWGGRRKANSISDAEQLLCLLLPATALDKFVVDRPGVAADTVTAPLRGLGAGPVEIALTLARGINDYLTRYRTDDGAPTFGGGDYFVQEQPATSGQLELDVVESYAVSIQLTLAAIGYAQSLAKSPQIGQADVNFLRALAEMASERLSAAMAGLLRSYAINVFAIDDPPTGGATIGPGELLLRTVAQQQGRPREVVLRELRDGLRRVAARLRDLDIGIARPQRLDDESLLFECGWTWGISTDAESVEVAKFYPGTTATQPGSALNAPYLYFTVVALDAISELFSDRTRELNLLTEPQLQMATALRLRWDLTQEYWAKIASFGPGRWPLEDIPWRTTDDEESDFFTLLVTSITARELTRQRATDETFGRLGNILIELANRGRLTRRPLRSRPDGSGGTVRDPAVALHYPGVPVQLIGSELDTGVSLGWVGTDYAPLLLKRTVQVADLIRDIGERSRVLALTDQVWEHVWSRRFLKGEARNLWDNPTPVFVDIDEPPTKVSWHHTLRVVETLVLAARLTESPPLRGVRLVELSHELLAEAQHRYDWELLQEGLRSAFSEAELARGVDEARDNARAKTLRTTELVLNRVRGLIDSSPGRAVALLLETLRALDKIDSDRSRGAA